MGRISETKLENGKTRIVISGKNSGWKYTIYSYKTNGERLYMWGADNDDDIEEYVQHMIDHAEDCGAGIPDYSIVENESGVEVGTIREFCERNGIDYSPLIEKVRKV